MFEGLPFGNFLVGLVVFFLMFGGGIYFILWMFNGRYPALKFLVLYGNTMRFQQFRQMGTMVVRDNLVNIILNKFEYMGELSAFGFFLMPSGRGLSKVYMAEYTSDYLFKVDKVNSKERVFTLDKKSISVGDKSKGILFPVQYSGMGSLDFNDIRNGKAIVERFKLAYQANKDYLAGNSPLMTMVYAAIPLLLVVLSVGVVLYLSLTAVNDTSLKMLDVSSQILLKLK